MPKTQKLSKSYKKLLLRILLYFVFRVHKNTLLPMKIFVRKVKKETIQKTENDHLNVSVIFFLAYLLLISATSETIATGFLSWNCYLKQIHALFSLFSALESVQIILWDSVSSEKQGMSLVITKEVSPQKMYKKSCQKSRALISAKKCDFLLKLLNWGLRVSWVTCLCVLVPMWLMKR